MDKKCQVIVDTQRAEIVKKMFEKVAYEKWSGRRVYHWLRFELNFHTTGNKPLACGNVYRTLTNHFYYGVFEYPKKSGNWYNGKHEPLISKELFDKVQEQLKRDNIQRKSREFAFTKLMVCGKCGSSISAEDKYKPLKDGSTAHYIYYGCSRTKDKNCRGNKYLREEALVEQILRVTDQLEFKEKSVRHRLDEELKRFNRFQRGVLGLANIKAAHEDVDLRTYAKYILKEGTNEEKRELMGCFETRLKITKGIVVIF